MRSARCRSGFPSASGRLASAAPQEVESYKEDVQRRAAELGLMELRWPEAFPDQDLSWALLAATYAKWIGRGVAFSLAALRQAFAAGRDLSSATTSSSPPRRARCILPR